MVKMLFKYRNINTIDNLIHFLDIINNNRLFFPKYSQLNDPLEGSGYVVNVEGHAGCNIDLAEDVEDRYVKYEKEQYRILSLSETCFSPPLWAHYANTYSGACIGFWTNNCFKYARKLTYIDERIPANNADIYGNVDNDLENAVKESFFYKHCDWSYENEFRIVEKSEEYFFNFSAQDLACIIIGNQMNTEYREFICKNIRSDIPLYYSYPGVRTFRINLLDINYDNFGSGSPVPSIYTIDGLVNDINKRAANRVNIQHQ